MLTKINVKNIIIFVGISLIVVFFGLFIPIFIDLFSEKPALLFALPVVMIFFMLLIFARNFLFLAVLLCRSFLDPIFSLTKLGDKTTGMGLGGVVNILVIGLAVIAVQKQPFSVLKISAKVWGVFLAAMLMSIFTAPVMMGAIKLNLNIISYVAIFTLPFTLIKSREDFSYWMKVLLFSSLVPVLYGYFQIITHSGFKSLHTEEGFRIESTLIHPNIFAFYLVMMITLLYGFVGSSMVKLPNYIRRTLPLYVVAMLVLVVFTKTRSAWAACLMYFLLYGALYDRRLLILAMISPLFGLLMPEVRERLMDINNGGEYVQYGRLDSYTWRKVLWQHALEWMDPVRYLFGYGGNSFAYYSNLFGGSGLEAHSVFIQLLFETGIAGFTGFLWLIGICFYKIKSFFNVDKVTSFTVVLLLIEYTLFSYSDNMLDYLAYNWYFWFTIGAVFALGISEEKVKVSTSESSVRHKNIIFLR